jgi:hypothetical protein
MAVGMSNKKLRLKKRRRRSIIAFEMIRLDRTSTEPLHQQLYRQIRDELKSGSISNGASRAEISEKKTLVLWPPFQLADPIECLPLTRCAARAETRYHCCVSCCHIPARLEAIIVR